MSQLPQNPLNNNDFNRFKALGIFAGEEYLIYVHKKTERLVSALYMISDFFKESEPMKWELREKGARALSASFSLNTSDPVDKNIAAQNIFSVSVEIISYLRVCLLAGILSKMNFAVLEKEFNNLINVLHERLLEEKKQHGYVLSQSFFDTTGIADNIFGNARSASLSRNQPLGQDNKSLNDQSRTVVQKADHTQKDKNHSSDGKRQEATLTAENANNYGSKSDTVASVKKDARRTLILDLLSRQSKLTIKDFTKVILDCSEKTIQRELVELVEKGVLKREGERRWSRYSLNQ